MFALDFTPPVRRLIAGLCFVLFAALPAAATTPPDPPPVASAASAQDGHTFIDDDDSIFEQDIEWLAAAGITSGCSATDYCPRDSVTRGQMAAFLHRALGQTLAATGSSADFVDDDNSIFEQDIEWLAAAGITSGCSVTKYCPSEPVTRGQMAAFLHRALGGIIASDPHTIDFTDDDDSIFEQDIEWLAGAGITSGCSATEYCPGNPVTRGQMAAFLHRAMTSVAPKGPADPDAGTGVDAAWIQGLDEPQGDATETGDLPEGSPGTPLMYELESGTTFDPERIPSFDPGASVLGESALPTRTAGPPDAATPGPISQVISSSAPQNVLDWNSNWLGSSYLPSTVGKLYMWYGFYYGDGRPHYGQCSGTLVHTNVVLTAAHCTDRALLLVDGVWNYYSPVGFYFVPDAYGPFDSERAWWGERRVFHDEFELSGKMLYVLDYALIALFADSDGFHAGDFHGWETVWYTPPDTGPIRTVRFSDPTAYYWYAPGYPASGPWAVYNDYSSQTAGEANWPWWCTSGVQYNYHEGGGYGEVAMGCFSNGGHSGGPIFQVADGYRFLRSTVSNSGINWRCSQYGIQPECSRYTMSNIWFPRLINDGTNPWGFDDVWNAMFFTSVSGGI